MLTWRVSDTMDRTDIDSDLATLTESVSDKVCMYICMYVYIYSSDMDIQKLYSQ